MKNVFQNFAFMTICGLLFILFSCETSEPQISRGVDENKLVETENSIYSLIGGNEFNCKSGIVEPWNNNLHSVTLFSINELAPACDIRFATTDNIWIRLPKKPGLYEIEESGDDSSRPQIRFYQRNYTPGTEYWSKFDASSGTVEVISVSEETVVVNFDASYSGRTFLKGEIEVQFCRE